MLKIFLLIVFSKFINPINIIIDTTDNKGVLPHLWKITGLCPPAPHSQIYSFLSSKDIKYSLRLISALPNHSIQYIRIHWLLNLLKIDPSSSQSQTLSLKYNFTFMDEIMDTLRDHNLKPIFELMGNPFNISFNTREGLKEWTNMLSSMIKRYDQRYNNLNDWLFETWNEPDNGDFDNTQFTYQTFNNYLLASWNALKSLKNIPKFGGPASRCLPLPPSKKSIYCWQSIKNAPYNFISIHAKGNSSLVQIRKIESIIKNNLPEHVKHLPLYNTEGDILKIWSSPKIWRADVTYASLAAKNIINHIRDNINISHDNGFLSYYPNQFTQRTLFARFQINNTNPNYSELIEKPIYTMMAFMSFMGDNKINYIINNNDNKKNDDIIDIIASKGDHYYSFVITTIDNDANNYNNYNNYYYNNYSDFINITFLLDNNFKEKFKIIRYHINNYDTNPYKIWITAGSPDYPSDKLFKQIRYASKPLKDCSYDIIRNKFSLNFTFSLPELSLILICKKINFTEQIQDVKVFPIHKNHILLTWKSTNNRCILSYIVEYSDNNENFKRINPYDDGIFPSFHYITDNVTGFYRIYAIDLFNQRSLYSETIHYIL